MAITVEKTGFKKNSLEDVVVAAEQNPGSQHRLEVGEVTQSVTVTAEVAPAIDTETGQISGTLTSQQIQIYPRSAAILFSSYGWLRAFSADSAHNNGGSSQNIPGSAGPGGPVQRKASSRQRTKCKLLQTASATKANGFQVDGVP